MKCRFLRLMNLVGPGTAASISPLSSLQSWLVQPLQVQVVTPATNSHSQDKGKGKGKVERGRDKIAKPNDAQQEPNSAVLIDCFSAYDVSLVDTAIATLEALDSGAALMAKEYTYWRSELHTRCQFLARLYRDDEGLGFRV